ncbi:MAG: SpoIIE family protein phosphatase [Bacteroidia bacterium]
MQDLSTYILDKLNTLVVMLDESGNASFVSNASKSILGYEPKQLLGKGWFDLTRKNETDRNAMRELVQKAIKNESAELIASGERLLYSATGAEKWILWNTVKGPDKSLIAIGYDITERKSMEQALEKANNNLLKKNKEIIESIQYAQRIQQAILPDVSQIKKAFGNAFVLYKPKDIVSGDFYWFFEKGNDKYVAAVDCTGHGVPGALMSVVAHSLFKEVFINKGLTEPVEILSAIDFELQKELGKNPDKVKSSDGMDVALLKYNSENRTITFAGAFRPLLLVRNNFVEELSGSRFPIGFYSDVIKEFTQHEINLQQGDAVYLFSDGYVDQFGGEKGKKLNRKRFKELLLTISEMETDEQEAFLEYAFNNWRQQEEQTDDIVVIGLKF